MFIFAYGHILNKNNRKNATGGEKRDGPRFE